MKSRKLETVSLLSDKAAILASKSHEASNIATKQHCDKATIYRTNTEHSLFIIHLNPMSTKLYIVEDSENHMQYEFTSLQEAQRKLTDLAYAGIIAFMYKWNLYSPHF